MTNLEYAMKEHGFNANASICCIAFYAKNGVTCGTKDIHCCECQFGKIKEKQTVEFLLREHKEPIKLKQWEYDLLDTCKQNYLFNQHVVLNDMKYKGYFQGIKDTSLEVALILENSIIVSDDYDEFEECK